MTHIDDIVPSMLIFAINDHWIMKHKNKIKKTKHFHVFKVPKLEESQRLWLHGKGTGKGFKGKRSTDPTQSLTYQR